CDCANITGLDRAGAEVVADSQLLAPDLDSHAELAGPEPRTDEPEADGPDLIPLTAYIRGPCGKRGCYCQGEAGGTHGQGKDADDQVQATMETEGVRGSASIHRVPAPERRVTLELGGRQARLQQLGRCRCHGQVGAQPFRQKAAGLWRGE